MVAEQTFITGPPSTRQEATAMATMPTIAMVLVDGGSDDGGGGGNIVILDL